MMTATHKEENTDQLSDDVNEPEDSAKKVFSEKKVPSKMPGKFRCKRKLFLIFIWGALVSVALLSYPFLKNLQVSPVMPSLTRRASSVMPSSTRRVGPAIPQEKRFPVENDRSIKFDSFIIPFEEHGRFTYISLSISFELPNKELMKEMVEKNTLIRGIIYGLLSKNIKILTNVSSLEKLKELITHSVNDVLTAGKVNEPIITDFSAV
jgi:flagellar basal body-associated protein FliL